MFVCHVMREANRPGELDLTTMRNFLGRRKRFRDFTGFVPTLPSVSSLFGNLQRNTVASLRDSSGTKATNFPRDVLLGQFMQSHFCHFSLTSSRRNAILARRQSCWIQYDVCMWKIEEIPERDL